MIEGNMAKTKELAEKLADVIRDEKPNLVEGFLAISGVMRSLGELFYHLKDASPEAVLENYKTNPNLPGALMIHADQAWEILKIFIEFGEEGDKNGSE
jgi:hypothetical protein